MSRATLQIAAIVLGCLVILGAAGDEARHDSAADVGATEVAQSVATTMMDRSAGDQTTEAASAPLYHLNWWSVNNGGATNVASASYGLGISVGQAAAGYAAGTDYKLGVGFWYGVNSGGGCPMTIFGDVDLGGSVTSGDIIYLVNFVFKGGPNPQPCDAAGDVDCGGSVTSGDIIYLVNFVFKGGPPPCNTCTSALAGAC